MNKLGHEVKTHSGGIGVMGVLMYAVAEVNGIEGLTGLQEAVIKLILFCLGAVLVVVLRRMRAPGELPPPQDRPGK